MKLMNPKNTKTLHKAYKAFALVSFSFAMMRDANATGFKVIALSNQCKMAMQGFHRKVGTKMYRQVADDVSSLYLSLNDEFKGSVSVDETLVFIEMLLNLLKKKDMNDFLLMTYKSGVSIDASRIDFLAEVADKVDDYLNDMFKVPKTSSTRQLANLFKVQDKKKKKVKVKKLSIKEIKHQRKVEEDRLRKERYWSNIKVLGDRARKLISSMEADGLEIQIGLVK